VCLEYFEKDAEDTIEVASALSDLGGTPNARALVALGAARSMESRAMWDRGYAQQAYELAELAKKALERALTASPFDTDAWGTLGGVYKRVAKWKQASGDLAGAERYRALMLEAYRAGASNGPDPYPILNYLEYRAVVTRSPKVVLDGEVKALERSLYIRKQQLARGENAPWAAFDLARGQHYLRPNVPRFLSDLDVAIQDARRVARRSSERSMVERACTALRDLHEAGVPIDGLDEATLLVRRAVVDDAWFAGSWGPLGRPEPYLVAELREACRALAELDVPSPTAQSDVRSFVARAESGWTEADEERFSQELERDVRRFKASVEPVVRKPLRTLWKACGDDGLRWAFTTGAASLAVGPSGGTGSAALVTAYVKYYVDRKVAAMSAELLDGAVSIAQPL
jgi:hypothetical protein